MSYGRISGGGAFVLGAERHCLYHLFTVKSRPPDAMHLRQRGHNFVLPKTFKDVKFTVDCTAFQAFITLPTKNF